jgi:hypothetical protein
MSYACRADEAFQIVWQLDRQLASEALVQHDRMTVTRPHRHYALD